MKIKKSACLSLFFAVLTFVFTFFSCKESKRNILCSDCNVILISIDSLRADHLGCYGYPRETSPNINLMSRDSVLFKKCISQGTSTLVSHAAMLTSLIPAHHGASMTKQMRLPDKVETFAQILKNNQYATVSFNDGGQLSTKFGLNRGFDHYDDHPKDRKILKLLFRKIVDKSIDWIEKNQRKKFFMFLHTFEVHHPYAPKKKYLEHFERGYSGKFGPIISIEEILEIFRKKTIISEEDRKHMINAYDAEIRSMDESFGRLMIFLKDKHLYDNTIIVLTADHGDEFGEHGAYGMHAHSLFNELLHVPFILKLGGNVQAGKEINSLTACIDFAPTLLELLGLPSLETSDGKSLVPLLLGDNNAGERFIIAQMDRPDNFADPENWALVTDRWKIYKDALYDLKNDPGEMIDFSSEYPELKESLKRVALEYMTERLSKVREKKIELDDELKEKLKSLGYIK